LDSLGQRSGGHHHHGRITGLRETSVKFGYGAFIYSFDANGKWSGTRNATYPAFAVFDPKTKQWDVAGGAEVNIMSQNLFLLPSQPHFGAANCSPATATKSKSTISKPDNGRSGDFGCNNYELFTVTNIFTRRTRVVFLKSSMMERPPA